MKLQLVGDRLDGMEADGRFAQLRDGEKARLRELAAAVRSVNWQAATGCTMAIQMFARLSGLPEPKARKTLYAVARLGWMGLMDRRKAQTKEMVDGLETRPRFITWVKEMMAHEGRTCRSAVYDILAYWATGKPVPGYEDLEGGRPPVGKSGDYPDGWSYDNLMRFKPNDRELKMMRVGKVSASGLLPTVRTSRVGLHVGEHFQADDRWFDVKAVVGVNMYRPLGLGLIDVASTKSTVNGYRARRWSDDGERHDGLKAVDMRAVLAVQLTELGFYRGGCTFFVEHQVAAIDEATEQELLGLSRGLVKVQRGGFLQGNPLLDHWNGKQGGNPRFKAVIESLHKVKHDRMGLLPAQTGSNSRLNKPETLAAVEKYVHRLADDVHRLPERFWTATWDLMEKPAISWEKFIEIAEDYALWIDGRRTHELEGWRKCGYMMTQYRFGERDEWMDETELARLEPGQVEVLRAIAGRQGLCRERMLSPNEVWRNGQRELARLPLHVTPQILGPDAAREVRINKRHEFEFQDAELDMATPLRYGGIVRDVCGRDVVLRDGETYRCFVNPIRPARMYVCEPNGSYIGHVERIDAAPRVNREAVLSAIADAAHRERVLLSPLRARHAADVSERAEMMVRNEVVLGLALKAAGSSAAGAAAETEPAGAAPTSGPRARAMDDDLDDALMELAGEGVRTIKGGSSDE